jgi:hypothetical protein
MVTRILLACLLAIPAYAQFSIPSSAPMTAALLKPAAPGGGGSWTPTDVANLVFWVKADGLTASDGDQPEILTDFSGNNRHFSQAGGTARALYTNSASWLNNKAVLWFDGSNDSYTNRTWTPSTGNYTFFCVMKQEKWSDFANRALWSMDGELTVYSVYDGSSYKAAKSDTGGTTAAEVLEAVPYVISMVANSTGTACQFYTNGVAAGSAGVYTPPTLPTHMRIGANTGSAAFYKQAIAEMFVYSSALSNTDREAAEAYLGSKYGITIQ